MFLFPVLSFAEVDQSIPFYIATQAKVYGVDVQQALYVSWQESHWDCTAIGDSGRSHGCWQIFLPAHQSITKKQAHDLEWSTKWAMQTMIEDKGCKQWSTCPLGDT